MGWFDEQIRQRMQLDDEAFSDAFAGMAAAVMGARLGRALLDERIQTRNALEEILKYYRVPIGEVPDDVTDLNRQMDYLLRPAGVMRRSVTLERDWYKSAAGAMLGVRKADGRVVALLPRGLGGYEYRLDGRRVRVTGKNAHELQEEALCFYKPFPQRQIGLKDLGAYILGCLDTADYLLAAGVTLLVTLIGMLVPMITRVIYGPVITGGSLQLLAAVFVFLLCTRLSQMMVGAARGLVVQRINSKLDIMVQAAGMARLFSLPPAFFKEYSAGEISSRVSSIGTLSQILVEVVFSTGLSSLFSLAYVAQLVNYGAYLVLPGMIVILATLLCSAIAVLSQVRLMRNTMQAASRESGVSLAMINGVQKIKIAGAEKRAFAQWASAYIPLARLRYDPPAAAKYGNMISACVPLVGTVVIYYFAVRSGVALQDYFAFQAAYGMVTGAFAMLAGMVGIIAQISPVMDMIRPLLETCPEAQVGRRVVSRIGGGVELSNVTFRYDENMPPVLDNLSLKIRPGQYVAIVGRTGCGKSTLMRMLLGFERPQRGAVYYDGRDLATLDVRSLRRQIGVVLQDSKLFQGDIYSNVTVTAPDLDMDGVWRALEMAGVADDVRNMPMGVHTLISEGSGGISGGQRQRLMIARAIAGNPRILMFDEATSALDNIAQKTVSDSLETLKCTRIVIAHRLSTIRNCDRILVMDKGRIIEDGSYDELMALGGSFADLVARQQI